MKPVTVITGGAGGMGFAAANIFGHQGHTLLLCDVKEEALQSAAISLKRQNMDVHYLVTDVSDRAQVLAAAQKAAELGAVKNVIHTAGLSPVLVEKLGAEEGRCTIVKVNALGAVYMTDAFYPVLEEGGSVNFTSVNAEQHFTQPPARYTEASLVRTLEEKGIGRPSTYAPTITTIISRGYVSREKKRLYPTELGYMVTDVMLEYFSPIVDVDFTAQMEEKLDEVEEGQVEWRNVLRAFYPPFEKMLDEAEKHIEKVEIQDEVSDVPCDKCGAMMVYKMGRFGRFLACPNFPECRNAKPILTYIDTPCPKCGARLMEKTSKKNRKFYGCEKYPECDFVSWEKPIPEKCPKCGSYMVEKRGKRGEHIHLCANETCRYKETVTKEEKDEE